MNRISLSVLALAVALWACPEKKAEPPPKDATEALSAGQPIPNHY